MEFITSFNLALLLDVQLYLSAPVKQNCFSLLLAKILAQQLHMLSNYTQLYKGSGFVSFHSHMPEL